MEERGQGGEEAGPSTVRARILFQKQRTSFFKR